MKTMLLAVFLITIAGCETTVNRPIMTDRPAIGTDNGYCYRGGDVVLCED